MHRVGIVFSSLYYEKHKYFFFKGVVLYFVVVVAAYSILKSNLHLHFLRNVLYYTLQRYAGVIWSFSDLNKRSMNLVENSHH